MRPDPWSSLSWQRAWKRHEGKAEKIEQYRRITRCHMEQFAGFVARLAEIREEERPLCDLHLPILGRMGIEAASFGDSTGPITELAS